MMIGKLAMAGLAASLFTYPAMACMGPQFERTLYPVVEEAPVQGAVPEGMEVFRVRHDGEMAGRQDRLWPNFFVVEIVQGRLAGTQALIPAHATSCHSVSIARGDSGYVTASVGYNSGLDGDTRPVLATGMTGREERQWPLSPQGD